jgi:hypothetical protein
MCTRPRLHGITLLVTENATTSVFILYFLTHFSTAWSIGPLRVFSRLSRWTWSSFVQRVQLVNGEPIQNMYAYISEYSHTYIACTCHLIKSMSLVSITNLFRTIYSERPNMQKAKPLHVGITHFNRNKKSYV